MLDIYVLQILDLCLKKLQIEQTCVNIAIIQRNRRNLMKYILSERQKKVTKISIYMYSCFFE